MGRRSPTRSGRSARPSAPRPSSASGGPASPTRRRPRSRRRCSRRASSASRSPSWSRRRAGSGRSRATSPTPPASPSRATTRSSSPFPAQTTDKILVASTGGRFYTLQGDKLPGGRGHGEPIRLLVDMDAAEDVVAVFVHDPGAEAARRLDRGAGLRRGRGRDPRQHPQGQAGDVGRCAGGDAALRRRARRHGGDARREPEAAALSARADPGDGARQGRPAAEVQGRRHRRRAGLRQGRGADVDGFVRAGASCARWRRSRTGSATAPRPAVCRRRVFHAATDSGRGESGRAGDTDGRPPRKGYDIHTSCYRCGAIRGAFLVHPHKFESQRRTGAPPRPLWERADFPDLPFANRTWKSG